MQCHMARVYFYVIHNTFVSLFNTCSIVLAQNELDTSQKTQTKDN